MNGFSEEWLRDHQAKIADQRVSAVIAPAKSRPANRPWLESDRALLLADYPVAAAQGELQLLAERMGRTKNFLARKAREIGLTNPRRGKVWLTVASPFTKHAEEFASIHETMSDADLCQRFEVDITTVVRWRRALGLKKDPHLKWVFTAHPKGATGLTLSEAQKEAMAVGGRAAWADKAHPLNSEEAKQARSDRTMIRQHSGAMGVGYSRGSMGRRADLGNAFFRSSWEANYARYLNLMISLGSVFRWEYEPDTFWFLAIKRGVRSYKPDFKIWETPGESFYYVEIKGYMDDKSKTKLRRMKKYYPSVRIDVIDKTRYRALTNSVSALLPEWESGGGRMQNL